MARPKIVRTTLSELDEAMRVNGIRKHAMILAGWALDPDIHDKKNIVQNYMMQALHIALEKA